jgi:ubiquinone/menaquinone biosynthesis C-methylase UbiE
MGLGKLLHHHAESTDGGGTIDHPRAYEFLVTLGFAGYRRRIFTRLAALSGARPADRVLDVGCGTGYLTRLMVPLVAPGGHITGVDPSPPMIDHARRHAPAACTYVVGEGQTLDLPDACFDVVVSSLALHHIPGPARAAAVGEMFRVLRPGGRLLIAEFRPPANHLAAHLVGLLTGPAMRHNLREQFIGLLAGAGFDLQDQGRLGPMLYYLQATRPTAAEPATS